MAEESMSVTGDMSITTNRMWSPCSDGGGGGEGGGWDEWVQATSEGLSGTQGKEMRAAHEPVASVARCIGGSGARGAFACTRLGRAEAHAS